MEYARWYPSALGVDGYGRLQHWVRVITYNGRIVSAYPTSRPFR